MQGPKQTITSKNTSEYEAPATRSQFTTTFRSSGGRFDHGQPVNDKLGSGFGSVAEIEARLRKYGKIPREDKEALMQIFRDVAQDPDWFDESLMYHLYQ